jgi:hypothetical protein
MVQREGMLHPRTTALALIAAVACAERAPTSSSPASSAPSASASESASVAAPDPEPPDGGADAALADRPSGPLVATRALASWIYEKPHRESQHVGVLRVGARIARSAQPVDAPGCNGPSTHWYSVEPRGFVCPGFEGVTLDVDDPAIVLASQFPPKSDQPFPYGYGTSFGTPLYVRAPTADEQAKLEGNVAEHIAAMAKVRAKLSDKKRWPELVFDPSPMPTLLADHALSPAITDIKLASGALVAGRGWPDWRMSFLTSFDVDGRVFYLTHEHFLVPFDRIRPAKPPFEFQGVELAPPDQPGEHLPIVWVNWHPVPLYIYDEAKRGLRPTKEELPLQAHAQVTAQPLFLGGAKFHELLAPPPGALEPGARYVVKDGPTFRVDALPAVPPNVGADDLWIDIAIASQTLVLYKGTLPIFATLVSTGVDGAGDPEKTKSTPRGLFRIRSKHITARMAAEEKPPAKEGDKPDPRYRVDDVPYVQYFHAGYALHGAYWHDNFGTPRSHGCVNLSPHDAMYIFQKTTPGVPKPWHGVFGGVAGGELGTWIHIRVY